MYTWQLPGVKHKGLNIKEGTLRPRKNIVVFRFADRLFVSVPTRKFLKTFYTYIYALDTFLCTFLGGFKSNRTYRNEKEY